jgi:hypothetical protein
VAIYRLLEKMATTGNLGNEINRILEGIKTRVMASMPAVIDGALETC